MLRIETRTDTTSTVTYALAGRATQEHLPELVRAPGGRARPRTPGDARPRRARPRRPGVRPVPGLRRGRRGRAGPLPRLRPLVDPVRGGRGEETFMKTQTSGGAAGAGARAFRPPARRRPRQTAPPVIRLSLADAISRALDAGTAVRIATTSTRVAEAQAQEARSALRPQLSAGGQLANETINLATFGFTRPRSAERHRRRSTSSTSTSRLAMNIIDFAARRRYEAARAGVKVTQEDQRRLENEVAAAVASLYVSYGRSSARIDEIRANVDLFQKAAPARPRPEERRRRHPARHDARRRPARPPAAGAAGGDQPARPRPARPAAGDRRRPRRRPGADRRLDAGPRRGARRCRRPSAAARQRRPELTLLDQRLRLAKLNIEAARAERLPTLARPGAGDRERQPGARHRVEPHGRRRWSTCRSSPAAGSRRGSPRHRRSATSS